MLQDLQESKLNVEKRIEWIAAETKRVEAKVAEMQKELEEMKMKLSMEAAGSGNAVKAS